MDESQIRRWLDHPAELEAHLRGWGLADASSAAAELRMLADQVPLDLVASFAEQLGERLPPSGAPERAFFGLTRFLQTARSPLAMLSLFERDRAALPTLVQVF